MSSARVLWYLWSRQIVNGVKRAVSTPRRLISVLVGIGYYVAFFMRPWDHKTSGQVEKGFEGGINLDPSLISQVVFFVFMLLSIFLSMGIFGLRNTFKQADVDVLFPTPISSKAVMFFRLFRDYAVTLLFPFLLAIFTYQPAVGFFNAVKKHDPAALNQMIRGGLISWILLAFSWVSIGYALSFFVAQHEKKSQLITRTVGWMIFLSIVAVFGYIAFQMNQVPEIATIGRATTVWWVRAIMFMPTAATGIVMGFFNGAPVQILLGLSVFAAVIGLSLTYAARLSNWMYDQAATKGFQTQALRDFQRKGDYTSIVAERARQGKMGKARIAKRVANWTFRGGWTLIYKEILIQSRIGFWMNLFFLVMISAFGLMFLVLPGTTHSGRQIGPALYLGMTGFMAVNMSSFQSYSGFVETLRRVEVMKPLPLTSGQIAFFETVSKAAMSMFMAFIPFLIGLIYRPALWQYHVAGMIAAPFCALTLVSAIFLVVVLFPDFEDPTQRSFRGIMQLIALVIVLAPTGGLFAAMLAFGLSPVIPALISAVINLGLTALLASIAGRFYADFNPSE